MAAGKSSSKQIVLDIWKHSMVAINNEFLNLCYVCDTRGRSNINFPEFCRTSAVWDIRFNTYLTHKCFTSLGRDRVVPGK